MIATIGEASQLTAGKTVKLMYTKTSVFSSTDLVIEFTDGSKLTIQTEHIYGLEIDNSGVIDI